MADKKHNTQHTTQHNNMTTTKYANGQTAQHKLYADSLAELLAFFPDMVTERDDDAGRTIVWADDDSACGDDGQRAVAVLTIS